MIMSCCVWICTEFVLVWLFWRERACLLDRRGLIGAFLVSKIIPYLDINSMLRAQYVLNKEMSCAL